LPPSSAGGILLIGAAAYLAQDGGRPPIATIRDIPIDAREQYWRERIQSAGSADAYAELAESIEGLTSPQKHFNAHLFGRALFDEVGLAGTHTCDGRFNYGCFHAFMIRAVEVRGASASQELHEACIEALGATAEQCEHGIGHGLLGIIGYGIPDIEEALAVCETLTPPSHPVGGCIGGIFMEYGLRGMQGAGETAMRPFAEEEALEPCPSISENHQAACAFWQPMWWMETHPDRTDGPRMAEAMGRWCRELPGGDEVLPTCIAGIANRMELIADGDPTRSAMLCRAITTVPRFQEYCQMKAAMQFMRYHPLEFSLRACTGLSDEAAERCRTRATEESAARRADQRPLDASVIP